MLVTVFFMIALSIVSPHNILHRMSAESISNDSSLKGEFTNKKVESVTYKGDNTYIVKTYKEEFVVQEYYTVMNCKWKVYELKKETN